MKYLTLKILETAPNKYFVWGKKAASDFCAGDRIKYRRVGWQTKWQWGAVVESINNVVKVGNEVKRRGRKNG